MTPLEAVLSPEPFVTLHRARPATKAQTLRTKQIVKQNKKTRSVGIVHLAKHHIKGKISG